MKLKYTILISLVALLGYGAATTVPAWISGNFTVTGTNTAGYFVGDGAGLTGIVGGSGILGVTNQNMLYVAKNGSDTTGKSNRLDLPFLTIGQAVTNAHSGDLVYVFSGNYTNIAPTNMVGFFFLPGAIINAQTNTPSAYFPLLSDTNSVNGSTNIIRGDAEFVFSADGAEVDVRAMSFTNANSVLDIKCRRFTFGSLNAVDSVSTGGLFMSGGKSLKWDGDVIGLGDLEVSPGFAVSINNVESVVFKGNVSSAVSGIDIGYDLPGTSRDMFISSDFVFSDGDSLYNSSGSNSVIWARTTLVVSTNGYPAYWQGRGKSYHRADKIWAKSTDRFAIFTTSIDGNPTLTNWTESIKITSGGGGWVHVYGGKQIVACAEYEDTSANGFGVEGGWFAETPSESICLGGMMKTKGRCLSYEGTNGFFENVTMDSSAGTNSAVFVNGAGLTLKDCTLLTSNGVPSLGASSAQTVTIVGTLTVNQPPTNLITFVGGTLIDTSQALIQTNWTGFGNWFTNLTGRKAEFHVPIYYSNGAIGTSYLLVTNELSGVNTNGRIVGPSGLASFASTNEFHTTLQPNERLKIIGVATGNGSIGANTNAARIYP